VNVGGLVASTEAISAQDLANGKVSFSGNSPNSVVNKGTITAAPGGYVAFIGAVVDNEGKIITPHGMTALGAGSAVDLSFSSNSLAHFQVSSAALNAAVKNGGAIIAPNGAVILTAQAKNTLLQTVVNNTGIIQAQGVAQNGGDIQLLGGPNGTASNSGTLDASSATGSGGTVTLTGQNVAVGSSAKILATGATGGGTINIGGGVHGGGNIAQAVTTKVAKGAVLNASATGQGDGGSITVWSDVSNPASITEAYGSFLAQGGPQGGNGGFVETSGYNLSVTGSVVETSAPRGTAGTWLLDPYNVTIAGNNASGTAFSSNFTPGTGSTILNSSIDSALNAGNNVSITTGAGGSSNGNITVNAPISWSTGTTLTFNAAGNIIVNAAISATDSSGTPTLAFLYGQSSAAGTGASYSINAPISLTANAAFQTKLGSSGGTVTYTVIDSISALQNINTGLSGDYVLGASLNDNNAAFTPLGPGTNNAFTGVFDGLGHTISNLTINLPGSSYVGLFGVVGSPGVVRDIGLVAESVSGSNDVGGLVGSNHGGKISAAYATGSVSGSGNYVGGLVGFNNGGTISAAYASGSVSGSSNVGGLVGYNFIGTIGAAYATGSVSGSGGVGGLVGDNNHGMISAAYTTGSVSGSYYVGGLVGFNNAGTISAAYATGSVSGSGFDVGGLVGANFGGNISAAYATGSVSGTSFVGGLVGYNSGGIISAAYATGSVSGGSNDVGGLVGINYGTISDGYWDKTTTGQSTSSGSTNNFGLTTAALAAALPSGFSSSVWANAGGQTTPYLLANDIFNTVSGSVLLASDTSATPTPYNVITSMTQLQNINTTGLGLNYVLGTNLTDTVTTGPGFAPIGSSNNRFTGIFDGLGYTISNLTINLPGSSRVGLFGVVGSNGNVRDIGLVGESVSAGQFVGGLVGRNFGTISNAYATGSVSGASFVGGLVGDNNNGTISAAYATGGVSGSSFDVGGLVGANFGGNISAAYATGSVSGSGGDVGGLVGYNGGTISAGYWDTTVNPSLSGVGNSNNSNVKGDSTAQLAALVGGSNTGFSSSVWANAGGQTTPYLLANDIFNTVSGSVLLASDTSATPAPYNVITSMTQLQNINTTGLGLNYVLGNSLNDSNAAFSQIGPNSNSAFTGIFNGLGNTISNLSVPGGNPSGLFGYVTGATISNIGLLNESIAGGTYVGGLVGYNNGGTISNAYATGSVSGSGYSVGGLVGYNFKGTISAVYATGRVSGSGDVGGLVGYNTNGKISNAYATGNVSGRSSDVGGLVGYNSSSGTISAAYATGSVSGGTYVGGLVGVNTFGGTITGGYWDTTVNPSLSGVGNSNNTNVKGVSTAKLAALVGGSNTGFSSNVWANAGGQTTPYLIANESFNTVSGSVLLASDTSATPTNYNVITSMTQLQNINTTGLGLNYVLGNSLNDSNAAFSQIGPDSNSAFTGIFNGLGNTISNLKVPGGNPSGLFGYVTGATISNIGLLNESIAGGFYVGGLVGYNNGGTISNAYATGHVLGTNYVGGLVGRNFGTISNAYATGSVSGTSFVGGLVGSNAGMISAAYATGSVSGASFVGGLVGYNSNGTISAAYATGSVSGNDYVGGLVGYNSNGKISNAYATGGVSGSNRVGGLVGFNAFNGKISAAYATGSVSGSSNVGGLVGFNTNGGTISDGYWDSTTTGQSSSAAGTGVTSTAQLAALVGGSNTGFSSNVWANGGGQTTPYLIANEAFNTVSGSVLLASDTSATPTPYNVITSMTQLQNINTTGLGLNYVLGNSLTDTVTTGPGFTPIGNSSNNAFTGIFDGLGYTISNLTINRPGSSNVGLFGYVTGATISNIGLLNESIAGGVYVGGLVGYNNGGTISNAYATGHVLGTNNVGGLVGYKNGGTISAAYATGHVLGTNDVGGLVGYNSNGTISAAYATGSVSGNSDVGGLVGFNSGGTISAAYATGSVSGSNYVGGLVGFNSNGTISAAYATGSVSGNSDVGGLVGSNFRGTISNAYATGSVSGGNSVGGLVGYNNGGKISAAYATGSVSGSGAVGGLVGYNYGGTISAAYATGSVSSGSNYVGGLVGRNKGGTISAGYWDTAVNPSLSGVGNGNNTNVKGVSTAALAALVGGSNTGFSSNVWANAGGQTTPYLIADDAFNTVSGSVLLASDTAATPAPYNVITSQTQLENINNALTGDYVLGTNLTASGNFTPIGSSGYQFAGIFDGLGHTISGLNINFVNNRDIGLFGYTSTNAILRNIGLLNVNVSGYTTVGGLVGHNVGTVSNSYVTGTVSGGGSNIGGIAGINNGTVKNSYATATIQAGQSYAGGLVGYNGGTISNSYATGNVSGGGEIGGLVGSNAGTIINSHASGNVTATGSNYSNGFFPQGKFVANAGGLAGVNHAGATISNSYATGSVTAAAPNAGGLVGSNGGGTIKTSYATGNVTSTNGSNTGGLVGFNIDGTISNAHAAAGQVTGIVNVGGLVGYNLNGKISNAYATGSVSGSNNVGGLVGINASGATISNAYATGQVTASAYEVGGLVGYNSNSTISKAYATGNVFGSNDVGGLVGYNQSNGMIENTYATGNVSSSNRGPVLGGLVGANSNSTVSNSYATGQVGRSSNDAGGLIGQNIAGTYNNDYFDTTTSGTSNGIGNGSSANVTGETTAALAAALPSGFSSSVWANGGNQTTPYLLANDIFNTVSGSVLLGSDTSATPTPYNVITSMTQLQNINATGLGLNYVLGNSLTDTVTTGPGFTPIGANSNSAFTGMFNGLGYTISNLTINRPGSNDVGLFGYVTGATISNIGLLNENIAGGYYVGGLVGFNNDGTISAAYATGSVSGKGDVGGLVGFNIGTISAAYATGSVSGSSNVGGLVGSNSNGTISAAYATGSVSGNSNVGGLVGDNNHGMISAAYTTGSVSGSNYVGGLVGYNNGGTISAAYTTGSVSGSNYVGGMVGFNNGGTISAAYATGSVSGNDAAGGLVGYNFNGTISAAYATGSVSGGNFAGGLVGSNFGGSITDSYWNTNSTGQTTSAGGGTPLTAAQMLQQSSFAGFDFSTPVWVIYNGHTTPLLAAFLTPITIAASNQSATYSGAASTLGLLNETQTVTGTAPAGTLFGNSGNIFGTNQPYDTAINAGIYTPDLYSDQQGYLISYSNAQLTINPKQLTASIIGNPSKTYNGTNGAPLTASNFSVSGFVSGQGASVTGLPTRGTYASANAGTNDLITASLSNAMFTGTGGTLLSNYILPTVATGPGTIEAVLSNPVSDIGLQQSVIDFGEIVPPNNFLTERGLLPLVPVSVIDGGVNAPFANDYNGSAAPPEAAASPR
jgi:hypothetical protein